MVFIPLIREFHRLSSLEGTRDRNAIVHKLDGAHCSGNSNNPQLMLLMAVVVGTNYKYSLSSPLVL